MSPRGREPFGQGRPPGGAPTPPPPPIDNSVSGGGVTALLVVFLVLVGLGIATVAVPELRSDPDGMGADAGVPEGP